MDEHRTAKRGLVADEVEGGFGVAELGLIAWWAWSSPELWWLMTSQKRGRDIVT